MKIQHEFNIHVIEQFQFYRAKLGKHLISNAICKKHLTFETKLLGNY